MQLPEHVLSRANTLLDDESRRILALQQRLEEETERARQRQNEFQEKLTELEDRETAIDRAKEKLEEKIQLIKDGKTEEFLVDLRRREMEIEELMRKAQEAAAADTVMSRLDRNKAIEEVGSLRRWPKWLC